jgi:ubiquinone/menaquinone biosynthesis C-methylase UbiE
MEAWHILLLILFLFCMNYMNQIVKDKFSYMDISTEGFESGTTIPGAVLESSNLIQWMPNKELYDDFYASVYDKLSHGYIRNQAEAALIVHEWTKRGEPANTFNLLDVGCGTGISVCAFAKAGIARTVGLDTSKSMLEWGKNKNLTASTLTEDQKATIEWREGDVMNSSVCSGGEFDHVTMLYFTVYYLADKESAFRNIFFWTKPGGRFVLQVVNKHKFDPLLESASPWVGFSLQKYSDKRLTRSEVNFNKFKYVGDFDLQDPEAEFRETFHFTDKTVRRQRHSLKMEDMSNIIGMAKLAGWEYLGFTDLTPIGFQYSFHLHFKRS